MNKFVKVILILSGVLFSVGVICTIVAFALGVTWGNLEDISIRRINGKDYLTESVSGSKKLVFDSIRNLNIETGAAAIRICYAPVKAVEIHYDSVVRMSAEVDNGYDLDIECGFSTAGMVDVLIPEAAPLNEIDLDIGAGKVEIEDINFRKLDADVGAGELVVNASDTKTAYSYKVNCGLGEIIIGDETYSGITSTEKYQGNGKEIDIDCGAGKVMIQFAE